MYGLMVVVSRHILDTGFCRLLEQKTFFSPFFIFPRVLNHKPAVGFVPKGASPARGCSTSDGALSLHEPFQVEPLRMTIPPNMSMPSIVLHYSRIKTQLFL